MFKIGHYLKADLRGSFTRTGRAQGRPRWGVARVFGYGAFLCVAAIVCGANGAKAATGETALRLGRDLAPLSNVIGDTTALNLNGEHMVLGSSITGESVKNVLDRFQEHCDANPGALGAQWNELANAPPGDRPEVMKDFQKGFVQRNENAGEGTIICLTKGARTPNSFVAAWERFSETKDVGYLGKMRWVYARKATKPGQTMVLTAFTEDSFNIENLAPEDGSEPAGSDSTVIPRPPGSKRIITASLDGTPYGLRLYQLGGSRESAMSFYDTELVKQGWINVTTKPSDDAKKVMGPETTAGYEERMKNMRFYIKDNLQVVMQFAVDDDNQQAVSISELGTIQGDLKP